MKMLSLTAICLAISTVAACSQGVTGVAKSPDNRAGPAAVQPYAQPETDKGGSRGDGGVGY